jgi:GT2 family glycosyltransferase
MAGQARHPAISVVIPCWGHASEIAACLRGLARQQTDQPYEVIVVDSAADPAVAKALADFPEVRLVRSHARLFPGGARNLGVKHARADKLAFTDADCVPEPGFVGAAIRALNVENKLVGGPVLHRLPFHPVAVADNLLQFADLGPSRPNGPASYFPGCNLALHRYVFEAVGGFPEITMAGEDTLLCESIAKRWPDRVRFVRDMRVRHTGRTRFRAFCAHQVGFGFARGRLGIMLRPSHRFLGRWAVMVMPVAFKRFSYIFRRNLQWNPGGLLYVTILSPLLLLGLVVWAVGFRRGLREADRIGTTVSSGSD